MALNPTPPRTPKMLLDSLRVWSLKLQNCPDCDSVFEHRLATFFLDGQTWDIPVPVCPKCDLHSTPKTVVAQKTAA